MRPTIPNFPKGLPIGLFAGGVVLAAGVAAAAMPDLIRVRPKVGDIVVFSPVRAGPGDQPGVHIVARRPGATGCVLDSDVMIRTGGSLIVEARYAGPLPGFRLHWAGQRTSAGNGDCGRGADLIVGVADLTNLVVAAEAASHPGSTIAGMD